MKRLLTVAGAVLASVSLMAQTPATPPAPPAPVTGVGNFSHIVADMDRALNFYRDVLGLEVTQDQPFSPNPAIMRLGNTPNAQSRFVALRVPGSDMGVELIQYKDIDRRPLNRRFVDTGAANLVLRVRDLAPILAKVPKSGARFLTPGGVPAAIGNGRYVFLQDPDGFIVELAEAPPPADSTVPATSNIFGGGFELTVTNIETSAKFYGDLLGIRFQPAGAWNSDKVMTATAGAPGASFRQAQGRIPGSNTTFTLIQFRGITKATNIGGRVQDPGTPILQLRVRDVDALTTRMATWAAPVITTGGVPVEIRPGLRIVLVSDPNGLVLELMQTSK